MIKLNVKAAEDRIKNQVNKAIEDIKFNAELGIAITNISFEKENFIECRNSLNEFCKTNNISFTWLDLGGMQSLDYGTHRLMKFKLCQ